jgi:hypothetical protein
MKKFVIMFAALLFMHPSYAKADVTLKLVSPVDAVKSAGGFVLDTGKKVCEGITTTAFGIGEVITAPFRAEYKKPKVKTYKYQRPRLEWHYTPSRFYKSEAPKTQRIPHPIHKYNIKHVANK